MTFRTQSADPPQHNKLSGQSQERRVRMGRIVRTGETHGVIEGAGVVFFFFPSLCIQAEIKNTTRKNKQTLQLKANPSHIKQNKSTVQMAINCG